MTVFAIVLAAILALVVLGFAGMLPFARRKDAVDAGAVLRELLLARAEGRITAEEFESRQAALHAAVLATPEASAPARNGLRWGLPLGVVAAALGLYAYLGNPQGVDVAPVAGIAAEPAPETKTQANSGGDLNTMVKRLADKMAKDPNNGDGWLLLARTYGELRQHRQAADAYAKAAALLPPEAGMLADWADAYVMSHDQKWDGEAREIVKRALKADPKHLKALALAGSEAFGRDDYKGAIELWKRIKSVAPADSMDARLADANIQEATSLMSGKKTARLPEIPPPSAITGTLSVSPKLKDRISASDTVFVVAKAVEGKGAPLAVKRYAASELPLEFRLDDAAAVLPGQALSGAGEALVSARISKSGSATPQAGDIISAVVRAKPGSQGVKLELGAAL